MTYGVSGTIQIVTKRFDVEHSKDRIFEGIATVEMVDKQNDLTVRDVLYDQFPVWMKRGAPINDSHSNRVVGKGLDYQKVTIKSGGKSLPAIKLTGQIYTDTEADDKVWKQIQSGEYKGLSFGGAAKNKTRMRVRKDGRVINKLDDLEMYEVSICFAPGSRVLMADESVKPIEDVEAGDMVIGHDGKPHRVTYHHVNEYDGELLKVAKSGKTRYDNKSAKYTNQYRQTEVWCTPNHEFQLEDGTFKAARDLTKRDRIRTATVVWNKGVFDFMGKSKQQYYSVRDSYQKETELSRIERERKQYEDRGYRYIVISHHAIPDAIAIKGDEVRAVEVQYTCSPNTEKYDTFAHDYDGIDFIRRSKRTFANSVRFGSSRLNCTGRRPESRRHYKGLVHNLAVEDAETYVVEGMVVHNCKSPVVPLALITSYSQVAKAVESGVDPSTMQIAGDVPVRCQMECDIAKGISARDGDVNKMSRKHKDDDEEIVVEEEEEKSKGEGQAAINESVYKAFEAVDSEFTEYSEKMDAMYKALKESLKATQDIDERLKALEGKSDHKDDEDKADDDDDEKGDDEDKDKGKRKSVVKGQRPQQASGKTGVLNVLSKARELGPGNQSELAEYVRGLTVND